MKNQCELFRFFIQRAAAHWRSQRTSTEAQHSERWYRLCSGESEVVPTTKAMGGGGSKNEGDVEEFLSYQRAHSTQLF